MEKQVKQKIVIVGCGNVAWHIAKHLHSINKFQVSVFNHKKNDRLKSFKTELKCKTESSLGQIPSDAAIYFVCVTDKFISDASAKISAKNPNALLLHTSGSAKLQELGKRMHSTGVFYPLQTFSRDSQVNWSEVPVIVEAENTDSERNTVNVANLFSKHVVLLDYKNRLKLHLAAVLVNNFTNALYVSAFDLLGKTSSGKNIGFEILLPLIEQTTAKIKKLNPRKAQTGPAKRKDKTVMQKHMELISKQEDLKKVYKQLSKLIIKQQTS